MPKLRGHIYVPALLLWLAFAGVRILNAACTPRAVAIGVSVYKDPSFDPNPVLHGKEDAEAFSDWFRHHAVCGSGGGAGIEPVIDTLTNEQATGPAIRYRLQDVFLRASADDEIFIFISARGIRAPGYGDEGYLVGSDGLKGRLYSSAVTVGNLTGMIPARGIGKVFLFADISRDLPNVNEIVSNLKGRLADNPKLSAVLSAQPKRISTDTSQYPQGLFTHFLIEELTANPNGKVAIPVFYQNLRRKILQASQAKQDPLTFGSETAIVETISPISPQGVERILIASQAPPPASAFAPSSPLGSSEMSNTLAVSARFEEQAQDVLLRYGEGNQFPDDPLRPSQAEFEAAADGYDRALQSRAGLPNNDAETRRRESLRARMLFCRSRALIYQRRYDEARDLLEQARSADPLLPEPANALGIAFLSQSRYDQAIAAFEQSIQLAGKWGYPRLNLALTFAESGNNAAAERVYLSAIRATPTEPYLYFNFGVLLARLNRRHDAELVFREAVRRFEDQAAAYRREAAGLEGTGAATALQRAETVRRNEAEAYNALGALAQGSKAARNYEEALSLNDRLYAAQYNLGIVAMRGRNYSEAIRRFEVVVQADPNFADAAHRLDCARKYGEYSGTRDRQTRNRLRQELKGCEVSR